MTETTNPTDMQAVLEAGKAIGEPFYVGAESAAVVPEGWRLQDLEQFHPNPRRTRGRATINRLQSLIDYTRAFQDEGTTVYANEERDRIEVVLDYPMNHLPRWGEHRAVYTAPRSKEWLRWTRADGDKMRQVDFAQFIEDHIEDIYVPEETAAPDGATMLEFAQTLNAKRDVNFKSSTRLSDGSGQINFTEEVSDSAGKDGQIDIPDVFYLAIAVYEGGPTFQVKAKIRYRINEGDLKIWFDLHRPEKVVETAFGEMVEQVEEETGSPVFWGDPLE